MSEVSKDGCVSLVEVPNLPASLKTLRIELLSNIESIVFGQKGDTEVVPGSSSAARASVLKLSSSANHRFFPCLELPSIWFCGDFSELFNLPPSIKTLEIFHCDNLESLPRQLDAL